VRASVDPLAVAGAVRKAVQSVDEDQAVSEIQTMDEVIANCWHATSPRAARAKLIRWSHCGTNEKAVTSDEWRVTSGWRRLAFQGLRLSLVALGKGRGSTRQVRATSTLLPAVSQRS
jgi:hypothetical protein